MAKSGKKKANKKKKTNLEFSEKLFAAYSSHTLSEKTYFIKDMNRNVMLPLITEDSNVHLQEDITTRTSLLYSKTYYYEQMQQLDTPTAKAVGFLFHRPLRCKSERLT